MQREEKALRFVEFLGLMSGLLGVVFALELPQIGEPIRPYLELVSTGILVVFIFCALVLYTASLRGIHVEDLERNVAGLFTMLLALAVALSVLLYSGVSSPSEGGALFVVILVASWFLMNYGINRVLKLTG